MLVRPCMLEVREERTSRRQELVPDSPPGKGEQDRRKCFHSGETGHLAAICQSKKKSLPAIEDGASPVQGDAGSLTASLHARMCCLAQGPVASLKRSFSHTSPLTQLPRGRSSLGPGPQCADLSNEVEQAWRLVLGCGC